MPVKEVAYRLKTDGKAETKRDFGEVGEAGRAAGKAAGEAFTEAGSAAERAAERAKAAAERQMSVWQAQAAKAREIQNAMDNNAKFDAFMGVGGIRKSAEDSARVFEEAFEGGLTRLQKAQRLNLTRQASDIFTMAAMGQSPYMIGVSQGPQIFDAWAEAGIKLNAELLKNVAVIGGVTAAAGGVAVAVKLAIDAFNEQTEAQKKAIAYSGDMEKINRQLANSSIAMVPVLQAEARALREAADAAYAKAKADRDRLVPVAERAAGYGDEFGAAFAYFAANAKEKAMAARGADRFAEAVKDRTGELQALVTTVRSAQDQISSGYDLAGRKLSDSARKNLQDTMKAASATAATEVDRLTALRDRFTAAGKIDVAKLYGDELTVAQRLATEARGRAAPSGRTRVPVDTSARDEREHLREVEESFREQEAAERRLNALTDVRLQFQLKLAKLGGDSTDLLDREIHFRQMIAQLTAAGLDKEEARAEAAKQVRLEVEAEAKARQAPKDFSYGERLRAEMEAAAAKLHVPTAFEEKLRATGDIFGDALHDGLMAAADDGKFFDAFRDRLKYSIMQAFADRATTSTLALLFGDQDRGGDVPGILKTGVKWASSFFGHNAQGTDNWRGGLSWVGEEGPELVDLPRGSKVFSAPRSAAMADGGQPIVFDLRGAVMTADLVAQMQAIANQTESRAVVRAGQQAGAQAYDYLVRNNLATG